jgi:hypothetical protein
MLPRLGVLEAKFSKATSRYLQTRSRSFGVMSQIRSHVIHEGKSATIQRSSADVEAVDMLEAGEEIKMSFEEIESADMAFFVRKLDEIADGFARKFFGTFVDTLKSVTAKTGQVVNAGGRPLTADRILEILELMQVNFERSEAGDLTIVAPPQMMSTFEQLNQEMRTDLTVKRRLDALMERKRDEFREREANRNLVG